MNSTTTSFTTKDKILCKFFLQGNCKNGAQCAWLHDEEKKKELNNKSGSDASSNPTPAEKNPQPCFFYFSGNCIKGDACIYSHELLFDDEETNPDVATSNKSEGKLEAANILMNKTMQQLIGDSQDKECSICFDGVVSQKRLFGLLSSCDHVYCLDCIRNWRATDQHDADKAVESVSHTCPMCRQLSLFVVPSPVHATGQIKDKITSRYLQRLKQIPCKYFKYGQGYCPFNAACFYAHLNKDGSVATLEQNLRNKPRARRRPGFLIDGQQPLMMSTRLLELIMPFLSDTVRSQILTYSIDEEDEELFDDEDADVMSSSDGDSDSVNMDYTHESQVSDDEDSEVGSASGSNSNNASNIGNLIYPHMVHNIKSHAYYDSDSDAPERQLYDGNEDPDGADEISSHGDSSMSVKLEQSDGSSVDNTSDSLSDSADDSLVKRSGSDLDSINIDMSDSSTSAPHLSSDSSDSNYNAPHEYDAELSGSDLLSDRSGSSPLHDSYSSMSDVHSNDSSSVPYQYGESENCNIDSDDCVSD